MTQRAITRRLADIARNLQQSFRPERWIAYTDDGGRLYIGDEPNEVPVTADELEMMQDDPAFNTRLVAIEYSDEPEAAV